MQFANDRGWAFHSCYGDARLIVNITAKGETWLEGNQGELLENGFGSLSTSLLTIGFQVTFPRTIIANVADWPGYSPGQ